MATIMIDPEGEEQDIPDAGVAALTRLGWTVKPEPKRAKKPADEE